MCGQIQEHSTRMSIAFLRMFGKTLKAKNYSFDKGCGRKVMVSGPARTFAFPKCCTEAGQRARSAAFIGDTAVRRLGRPGATASWRSQHRFWSVQ